MLTFNNKYEKQYVVRHDTTTVRTIDHKIQIDFRKSYRRNNKRKARLRPEAINGTDKPQSPIIWFVPVKH